MSTTALCEGNDIAACVLQAFKSLPQKYKPIIRPNGVVEWTVLSGIVVSYGTTNESNSILECVAFATGMKCLPRNKLPTANGRVLHDCHAEILAVRTFNRFLIDECSRLAGDLDATSHIIERRQAHEMTVSKSQPFTIKGNIRIHMYCSEAPCGDASMELVMEAQLDPTPWNRPPRGDQNEGELHGRADFARLGIVRRKPARPDAPQSLSKSCSDKLALYQCISVLRRLTAILIAPENAYLSSLVLPSSQLVPQAVARAFGSRGGMKKIAERLDVWKDGYGFDPFQAVATDLEFDYSKRSKIGHNGLVPSNKCIIWSPYFKETIINGVLQGRKASDKNAASLISRRQMWHAVDLLTPITPHTQYRSIKKHHALIERTRVKNDVVDALGGWIPNDGDDVFSLAQEA